MYIFKVYCNDSYWLTESSILSTAHWQQPEIFVVLVTSNVNRSPHHSVQKRFCLFISLGSLLGAFVSSLSPSIPLRDCLHIWDRDHFFHRSVSSFNLQSLYCYRFHCHVCLVFTWYLIISHLHFSIIKVLCRLDSLFF